MTSVLTLATAVACGTMAGAFFAFSTFVMKALARLPPNEGIAAMQSINVAAVNSWFLAAFLVATARAHGLPLLTRDRKMIDAGLVKVWTPACLQ